MNGPWKKNVEHDVENNKIMTANIHTVHTSEPLFFFSHGSPLEPWWTVPDLFTLGSFFGRIYRLGNATLHVWIYLWVWFKNTTKMDGWIGWNGWKKVLMSQSDRFCGQNQHISAPNFATMIWAAQARRIHVMWAPRAKRFYDQASSPEMEVWIHRSGHLISPICWCPAWDPEWGVLIPIFAMYIVLWFKGGAKKQGLGSLEELWTSLDHKISFHFWPTENRD